MQCSITKMCVLRSLLFALFIPLSLVRSAVGLIHVSGYEGVEVNVSCPYDGGYEYYEKYLCKNDCGYDDVLIKTTEANTFKYSIHDDKQRRVFTATISHLTLTDAGKYWCGVTRNLMDVYTEVKLEVGRDSCCDESTKAQSDEESSVSISCPYESKYQNNLKYVCRGKRPSTCLEKAVITSENKHNGQFRLTDDEVSRKVIVTITSLTQKNAGWYLCGVRNTGLDVFSAFELEVHEWCCVKSTKLSGIVGRPVTMHCPYPPQHRENRKFLCKGDHRNNCTNVVMRKSGFTLQEDISSSSFLVMIAELKAGDGGTYWCGSDSQWGVANYNTIQLSVVLPQQTSIVIPKITVLEPVEQSTQIPGNQTKVLLPPDAAHFHPVVFILPAVVLLALTLALVIVYKYKCNKVRGSRAKRAEEVMANMYGNQAVACSKQGSSRPQDTIHYDDAAEAQQESVYQNFSTTEDIYCNQINIAGNRR